MANFEGKPDVGDISSEGWEITTAVALSDGFPTGGEILPDNDGITDGFPEWW